MAEKFPTSTDEAQSSCSETEMRDAETGEILRQQISRQLENYTSNSFHFMTASGSELSILTSDSSTDIQPQFMMSACFSFEEISKMATFNPVNIKPENSVCNISDTFSYREPSPIDSSSSSDSCSSSHSAIFGSDDKAGMSSLSSSYTSSSGRKDIKPKIQLPDFLTEDSSCLSTYRRWQKNKSKCEAIHRYFDSFDVNHVPPIEISPPKQPATGGSDFSDFGDSCSKTESEQPVHISPKYPRSVTLISVSEGMNSGRDQSTSDNQINDKTKFTSTPNLTETRMLKRFRVDEAPDSRKSKYFRLQTDQTITLHSNSPDSCTQTERSLMGEDISRKNSHLLDDQMSKMEISEENSSDSHESFFRTV